MKSQSSLFVSLILVFASGMAVGAVGHYLYTAKTVNATSLPPPNADSFRKQFVEDMSNRVGLKDDQVGRMNTVLDQTRLQYKEVRDRMKPDMNRIKTEQIEKINAILTPDQRKLYEQLRLVREEKSKQTRKSVPPGH